MPSLFRVFELEQKMSVIFSGKNKQDSFTHKVSRQATI